MFENNTITGHGAPGSPGAGEEPESLRPLVWGELVARFAAARDLRHAVAATRDGAQCSFDRSAARHLHDLGQGKPAVNPDGLGICKSPARITGVAGISPESAVEECK